MAMFLGTHHNRLDAKNRVSIPASFRDILRTNSSQNGVLVILRPSHLHPCLEGWSDTGFNALAHSLTDYDPFSEEYEDMSLSLYADAYPIESDKEGRIIIPDILKTHAELDKEISFMGLGHIFQIWNPQKALERRSEARSRVKKDILSQHLKKAIKTDIPPSKMGDAKMENQNEKRVS